MKNKAITLVRNGPVLYPYQESDYEGMVALGAPITHLTIDYLPVLGSLANKRSVNIQYLPFEPIESEMFKKVLKKWKHSLLVTHVSITLTYPKGEQSEESVENLTEALRKWYRKHFVTLEVQLRRTAKKVTLTLRKTYEQPT